ncbi:MAG: hypothetical protein CVV04_00495 [Firmicutes bacterium HGW-Firmicutes-9]|jgi:hypothetical protein|nr:MAG: hypothetical protein CVV04_00495 [Firmicutes bacterium HGW-Firmicutes-9]
MKAISLPQLRAEAKRQLMNYRRNNSRVYRSSAIRAEGGEMLAWIRAIDSARIYLRAQNPAKERYMTRLFGLETPLPRSQPMRARLIRLSEEMCVSESTLYKWREDILEVVLYAAMEAGVIGLFGIRAAQEQECAQNESNTSRD